MKIFWIFLRHKSFFWQEWYVVVSPVECCQILFSFLNVALLFRWNVSVPYLIRMPMRRTDARWVRHCSSPHCNVLYVLCYTVTITITTTIMTTSADYHQYSQHTHSELSSTHKHTDTHTNIHIQTNTLKHTYKKQTHTHEQRTKCTTTHT